ncbi:uncharacterized protein LOC106161156 [Lingula anatina]|uniref:Uncharacterized protein LOC106161156 n=1 Tax=Lingula anatina TaxID=7574 RepID=A0A1S3I5I3_LINAN|nr:uncharacterized protein LOC106161156 [Lingula anatina]|eukprot:XP_013393483.1 uncharacterized protein LOC106161156 [Lingula anatina]
MALSKPSLTPEMDEGQENYLRLRVLLERASDVLRDVLTKELHKAYPGDFDQSTGLLYNVLNIPAVRRNLLQLSRRNVLNASQKQILYPAGACSLTAKVNDFDVTLAVLLLRNITTLNPSAKWNKPLSSDLSTEADIGRVKTYRNKHMHGVARLSAATFQSDFEGLKTVLLRLSKIYTEQDYDHILIKPIQSTGVPTACQLMSVDLPRKDSNFCGREDLLTEIQEQVNNSDVLLLTGMGGIGKTSIAVEMGHHMSEKGRNVFFLDMRQVENLGSVQLSLVQHYNPQMFLKEIYADHQNLFQKTLSEIKSATVVIFDNIDNLLRDQTQQFMKLLQDMLKASKHISLVCTSRESIGLTSVKVNEKVISHLDVKSSTWLLSGGRSVPQTEDVKILEEIAARCGYCPLALKLLAPQIRKKGGLQMQEKIDRKGVLEVADSSKFEGMKSTLEISFEALSDSEKDMFCSLYIFPVSFNLTDVSNILQIEEGICEDIFDSFTSKSLVNQVSDQVYDLHPLLKAFSESQAKQFPDKQLVMEISYYRYYCDRAATLVVIFESSIPKDAYETAVTLVPHLLFSGKLLLKHLSKYLQNKSISTTALDGDVDTDFDDFIQRLLDITIVLKKLYLFNEPLHILKESVKILKAKQNNELPKRQTSLHLSFLYEKVGDIFCAMGKYDDALKYHKKSLEIHEELLGNNHTVTSDSYNNIGIVLHEMGKNDDALKYYKKSLVINEEQFNVNPLKTADSYNNIGNLLCDMGKYNEALTYHRKSLEIQEKLLGTKHTRTAGSYNSIGNLLLKMGMYDDALNFLKKSLEIQKELLGTNHTAISGLYNNIGLVLLDMGKYDDALSYQSKGLAIQEQLIGTKHPSTADLYNNIGTLLKCMGKYDDALTYHRKCLKIREELFGTKHTKTAASYANIGSVLHKMGKYEDALTHHRKSLEISEELCGTNHSETAGSYSSIGLVLHDMGKFDDALTYHRKSLEIRKELLGDNHRETAMSYNNIGILLHNMGKLDDALIYLKKSIAIGEEQFSINPTDTVDSYSNYGDVLCDMGRYDDALTYQKKGLEICEKLLGTNHTKTAQSLNNIGLVLHAMGKFDDALTYHKKSLEIHENLLGTNHTKTAAIYNNIGRVLQDMGKFDDALAYLKEALEIHEKLLGTKHLKTAVAYISVAVALREMGMYAESLKYFKNALDIYETHFGVKHEKTALCYLNIGEILVEVKLYRDGVLYLKKCASVQEELLGITHPSTIDTCKVIGTVLIVMARFTEAIKYFKKIKWNIAINTILYCLPPSP